MKATRVQTRRRLAAVGAAVALSTSVAIMAVAAGGRSPAGTPAAPPAATAPAGRSGAPTPADVQAARAEFEKAKDLYAQGKFADAALENDRALALDPTLQDAVLLKTVIESKLTNTPIPSGGATAGGKLKILTTAQISVIRLMETRDGDNSIKGSIPRQVLEDFWNNVWTKDANNHDISKNAHDQFVNPNNFAPAAHLIKDARDMEYISKINITTDPQNMIFFSNTIHSFVLQNCATAVCHGGEQAGSFRLLTSPNTPEVKYTNFYIMSMYVAKTANAGARMIDRNNPEKSLLIQYALPHSIAALQHPKVDTKKIGTMQDSRVQPMLDWMSSLQLPMPNYGITYDLPGGNPVPTPTPVTAPATATAPATTRARGG